MVYIPQSLYKAQELQLMGNVCVVAEGRTLLVITQVTVVYILIFSKYWYKYLYVKITDSGNQPFQHMHTILKYHPQQISSSHLHTGWSGHLILATSHQFLRITSIIFSAICKIIKSCLNTPDQYCPQVSHEEKKPSWTSWASTCSCDSVTQQCWGSHKSARVCPVFDTTAGYSYH